MAIEAKKAKKAKLDIRQNLVLVGLMGAGKTTIGRRLSSVLSLPFVDSDQEIVEAAGCSISDIFEIYGEDVFRDLEKRVMQRLLGSGPSVIATGGGAFMNAHIRESILKKATAIWLKADLDVLLERVSRRDTRPLLKTGDRKAIMSKLMDERYPVYSEAPITIDSSDSTHESVVDEIIAALRAREQT